MAFISYSNAVIKGITTCLPPFVEKVENYPYFSKEEADKFSKSTGVFSKHVVKDSGITASDLCLIASEKLIEGLSIERESIEGLIFVSQTRDYILPSTSCILQDKLGLPDECYTLDIPYGCSGYIYGLQNAFSLVNSGEVKRVLLLVGDVVTPHHNPQDKSSYPLFGDAGSATLIEYQNFSIESDDLNSYFHFGTDGSGYQSIIIPDGGYRSRASINSFELKNYGAEGKRTDLDCALNGMDVFSFGISRPPQSIKKLFEKFQLNPADVNHFIMHQANKFLNEKIRKKLKFEEKITPYCLDEYGNTSCTSIPLTICSQLSEELMSKRSNLLMSAFGVGLSWATAWLQTNKIFCEKPFIYEL